MVRIQGGEGSRRFVPIAIEEKKHVSLLSCSDNDGLTCPLPTTSTARKAPDGMKDHRGFVVAACPQAKP